MGELHLEIVLERIRSEYGVEASLGAFQVAYKETALNEITDVFILDKTLGNKNLNFLKIDSDD
jgi:elongation factor G